MSLSTNSPLIQDAIEIATIAHEGQVRRFTNEPYINHPLRVAARVEGIVSENGLAAAILHDSLKDTALTFSDINTAFGYHVVTRVLYLTEQKPAVGNRAHRKAVQRARMHFVGPGEAFDVHTIKMADCIDNMPGIREHDPNFWKVMYQEMVHLGPCLHHADKDITEEFYAVLYDRPIQES